MSLTEEMFLKLSKVEAWALFQTLQSEKMDMLEGINKNVNDAVKKLGELEVKTITWNLVCWLLRVNSLPPRRATEP